MPEPTPTPQGRCVWCGEWCNWRDPFARVWVCDSDECQQEHDRNERELERERDEQEARARAEADSYGRYR